MDIIIVTVYAAEKDHPKDSRTSSDRRRLFEKVFTVVTYAGLLFLILYSFSISVQTEPLSLEPEIGRLSSSIFLLHLLAICFVV